MDGRSIYRIGKRDCATNTAKNIAANKHRIMTKKNRKTSGPAAGNRPGEKRSSGKKPSGTNVSRGGGSAAATGHSDRGKTKAKSKRGG
jgi:hypothetical protein